MCAIDFGNTTMDDDERAIAERISELKLQLGEDLLILGHHYQRDQIVMHADLLGDSFLLSEMAAASKAKNIVFCGVHFMAESADILTDDDQIIILPNLRAGCSMADMAVLSDVEQAWQEILESNDLSDPMYRDDADAIAENGDSFLVPVTYMNSSAELKAFVGRHGGVVCTSTNAQGVLEWAFERAGENGAVLFFPDQHLGRNTGLKMGIPSDKMAIWTPNENNQVSSDTRIILWHGYCSVHKRFTVAQIEEFRQRNPQGLVVVHPECPQEVVAAADTNGSTEFIRNYVAEQPSGSQIAIGTEINMVARLNNEHSDMEIECLDDNVCPCSTMYMIHPVYLLDVLERIIAGEEPNRIIVADDIQAGSLLALNRMLAITR